MVIENLGAGVLEGLGMDLNQFEKVNSRIALVRISDYGQSGPYSNLPASDLTVQARANWVSNHHVPGVKPVQAAADASRTSPWAATVPRPHSRHFS